MLLLNISLFSYYGWPLRKIGCEYGRKFEILLKQYRVYRSGFNRSDGVVSYFKSYLTNIGRDFGELECLSTSVLIPRPPFKCLTPRWQAKKY